MATLTPYRSKRAFDVLVAAAALVIAAPAMAAIAIGVRMTSSGPVIYRAKRVGRAGAQFTLYKFRSMRTANDSSGHRVTAGDDPRVTRFGRLLRSSKLDELPQLVNVLLGHMSIVGPRPEDPMYVDLYTDRQRRILDWRPGLTSPASIAYRHEEDLLRNADDIDDAYTSIMSEKLELDLAYFPTSSLHSDLGLVLRTVRSIFS